MTRKGGITHRQLNREWPHHVALPAGTLRSAAKSVRIFRLAKELGAPRPYHLERDTRALAVFRFARPDDAQTFAERFGGEMLPVIEEPRRRR